MYLRVNRQRKSFGRAVANTEGKRNKLVRKGKQVMTARPDPAAQAKLQIGELEKGYEEIDEDTFKQDLNGKLTVEGAALIHSWASSDEVYTFADFRDGGYEGARIRGKILKNINTTAATGNMAVGRREGIPALFQAANYKHSTKTNKRLPTLYFDDGNQTGRLRQQHKTGPLAQIDERRKTRLGIRGEEGFIKIKEKKRDIEKEGLTEVMLREEMKKIVLKDPPEPGDYQLEFYKDTDGKEGWHRSEGTVVKDEVNDQSIKEIFGRILGRTTEV